MQEKHDVNPQKVNATLARFYGWVKQCERNAASSKAYPIPVAKTDKEKRDDAFYTL